MCIPALVIGMYLLGYHQGIGQSPGYVIAGTALVALFYGSLLILAATAIQGTPLNRIFTHPILLTYGKYSYAVYLLHLPIMMLLSQHVFRPDQIRLGPTMLPGLLLFYAISWTLALLAGIASWNVLEKHFLKLKKYFPMQKVTSETAL